MTCCGAQVGHTGDLKAVIRAVAVCDAGLGQLLETVESLNGRWMVTSDHGNADDMVQVRHTTAVCGIGSSFTVLVNSGMHSVLINFGVLLLLVDLVYITISA